MELIGDVAGREGLRQVDRVKIGIGALSCVEPEALTTAYQAICQGTRLEESTLEIHLVPPLARCSECGQEFEMEDPLAYLCPNCSSVKVELLQGRELMLESITGEKNGD